VILSIQVFLRQCNSWNKGQCCCNILRHYKQLIVRSPAANCSDCTALFRDKGAPDSALANCKVSMACSINLQQHTQGHLALAETVCIRVGSVVFVMKMNAVCRTCHACRGGKEQHKGHGLKQLFRSSNKSNMQQITMGRLLEGESAKVHRAQESSCLAVSAKPPLHHKAVVDALDSFYSHKGECVSHSQGL